MAVTPRGWFVEEAAEHRRTRRGRRWARSLDQTVREPGRHGFPREFTTRSRFVIISDGRTRSQIMVVLQDRRRVPRHHARSPRTPTIRPSKRTPRMPISDEEARRLLQDAFQSVEEDYRS